MSEFDKLNRQVSIPREIYIKFGGRANLIYFLEHGEKELTELKEELSQLKASNQFDNLVKDTRGNTIKQLEEKLEKVTKIAEEVTEFYGDEYNYDLDDYYGISGEMRFRCVLNKDKEERNDVYQYAGKLARQKHKELKEILNKGE